MTPEALAAVHARAFAGQGRAWHVREFAGLLADRRVFLIGDSRSFALGRAVADEAEILTIATDPDCRRQGLARHVMDAFEAAAVARRAETAFLEVAADNTAGLGLYRSAGYTEVARRKAYYATRTGQRTDALIMRKPLGQQRRARQPLGI